MYRTLFAIVLAASTFAEAQAAQQSLEGIRARVEHFVTTLDSAPGRVEHVDIDRLDERLRLPACGKPLAADLPNERADAQRLVVRVRCPGPKPWKVYVPTRIERSIEVVVTRHPVPRGTVINADDIARERRTMDYLRGQYYTHAADLVGLQTTRTLAASAVVDARHVSQPTLVRRGENLLLEARGGSIQVSMKGKALEDGSRGERIRVRNVSSQRIVEAEVLDRGRAAVVF